jgi:hypothetical protein
MTREIATSLLLLGPAGTALAQDAPRVPVGGVPTMACGQQPDRRAYAGARVDDNRLTIERIGSRTVEQTLAAGGSTMDLVHKGPYGTIRASLARPSGERL